MAIFKSSNSGIPFGNNAGRPSNPSTGQPYFNGESQRLELYTGATYGWQNIVAETPGVTGYTGTLYELNGGTITITGSNFVNGATVTLIGNDNTEYNATSVTVSNLTSITATFGAVSGSKEPYDIKVTNPSSLYGVYYDIVTVNDAPVWTTTAGLLGTFNEGTSISITVAATDEENNTIVYSVASGSSLPSGLTLNSSTGVISGTTPIVTGNTTYSFTISASDGNNVSTRVFSISITNRTITWNTSSGNLTNVNSGFSLSTSVSATNPDGTAVIYSSSTLPAWITLNSSTGVLTGTAPSVATDTIYSFSILAGDGVNTVSRSFTVTVIAVAVDIFGDGSGLALWQFENNANDYSGNYNGTASNLTYSSASKKLGTYSAVFNGTSSTVSIPSVKNSYPLAISLWATNDNGWSNTSVQGQYELFNMSIAGNRLSLGWTYSTSWNPQKGFTVMYGNSNHWLGASSTTDGNSTSFFHIVYCIPSYNGTPVVYVNGTSINMINQGGGHGGSAGWNIGSNSTSGEYWPGKIDQLRFFNKVLSQSEVNSLYNSGSGA